MLDEPLPVDELRPYLSLNNAADCRCRALFHVAAHRKEARCLTAEVVANLTDPATAESAGAALLSLAPIAPEFLPTLVAQAQGSESQLVRHAATSLLHQFGDASVGAIPDLEKLLASDRPSSAWWPLLHIDPNHRAATNMVFDLLASDLEILATVARLPVLGEPLWAGLEQLAATDHGFVALDLLRRRADDPERALAIVQRILTSMSKGTMEKTFASLGRREEVVLCALARINRYDHSLLTDEMIAVLIDRVRAGLDRRNPAQLATTAELLAGLIYLQPSPPAVVNLITQTFTLARELYGDHASASRAIVTELTQAMSHNPSLAGSRLGPSLTEWAREPVIGEAVAALVDEHGWSSENATKSCSRYWTLPRGLPHPASTKEATPSPVVPTSDDLARLGMETQKAYAFTRMAPDVCVSEGIALLDDRVCQIRSWFLTPQGLPNTAERMLALVLGDLFVRGHDWSWLGLQSEESKILNAIFGDPAPEPFERKQLAVLSPDGTVAIDLHRAIRRELREPTTAARLYKLVTSFLDPAIRRELKEIGHVWEKPHWGLS